MLNQLLDAWSALYSNHAALRTAVEFAHVAGLVMGGGCAIAADLATITSARDGSAMQAAEMQMLKRTHRLVIAGLAALVVSGALLLGADLDTYWHSRIFWLKMAMIAALLANGGAMLRAERRVARGDARAWSHLHRTATVSLALWFLTTLAGAALPNIG